MAYNAATGAQLWVKRYAGLAKGGIGTQAYSVAVSPSGTTVYVTGFSGRSGEASGSSARRRPAGRMLALAARCSPSAAVAWAGQHVPRKKWKDQDWINASKSLLIVSACVVGIPCGKPGYVFSVPFFTSSTARGPELA
jgi:hypothetical protein